MRVVEKKRELIIKRIDDSSEVKRIDVSGSTERQIEKIERGLAINFNFDQYYWVRSWEDY